jgi:hypothetical protein
MADQSHHSTFFPWGSLNYGESIFGDFSLKRRLFRAEPERQPEVTPASPERRQQWVEEEQEFNDRLLNLRYRLF